MNMIKRANTLAFVVVLMLAVIAGFFAIQTNTASRYVWRLLHVGGIALSLDRSDAQLAFEIGNYYFGDGAYDLTTAERAFKQALAIDPRQAGAHYQLARVYFIKSDFADALREINTELELYPDFKRSYYVRALINGYSGKLADAQADFKTFLEWKPSSWAANNDLAWVYFEDGKYAEAADAARAGLTIAPNNPWLLNSLGVALLNAGDKAGAKQSFEKALAVVGTMTDAQWGAAYPGNDPGVYSDGLSQMKESLEKNLQLTAL